MLPIKEFLSHLPEAQRYWLAFSGGLDSTVLLHLAKTYLSDKSLQVIHINHGLQSSSDAWEKHCEKFCQQLQLPYHSESVAVILGNGESPEAAARNARYTAIGKYLTGNDCLLTAHHRDDQAETLLLQLLRGSGPKGLASMPTLKKKAGYWHARPLLGYSRAQLQEYASQHQLQWIEDGSNQNCDFDRNYLRQQIIPLLKTRWPSLDVTLSRSAGLQAEASVLLEQLAEMDYQQAQSHSNHLLSISALTKLSPARQANLIRYCLSKNKMSIPSQSILDEVLAMIVAAPDSNPLVQWSKFEVRRYRDTLYFLSQLSAHNSDKIIEWDLNTVLELDTIGLTLTRQTLLDSGIQLPNNVRTLEIRFRQGGEKIKLKGRDHTSSLKNLLQEMGVPPWLRDRLPILYLNDEMVAALACSPVLVAEKYSD